MYVENGAIKGLISKQLEELIKVKGNSFDQFVAPKNMPYGKETSILILLQVFQN